MLTPSTHCYLLWARRMVSLALLTMVVGSSAALAQSFPPAEVWAPLPCGASVMVDGIRDQSGAVNERDIVGDPGAPAGYTAFDEHFLYVRLRLEQAPRTEDTLRPFAWGVEVSLDEDPSTYELLFLVNGYADAVEIYKNSETTLPDDPADPPDTPPLVTYPTTSHLATSTAGDSTYGGDEDFFLDFAVAWSDIKPLGLEPTTPALFWVGSSSSDNALNGDLACHDDSTGTAKLSEITVRRTIIDTTVDSDSDGYPDRQELIQGTDPQDSASHPSEPPTTDWGEVNLEGGGGCTILHPDAPDESGWALLMGIVLFFIGPGLRRSRCAIWR